MKWLKNIEDLREHILSGKERASKRYLKVKKAPCMVMLMSYYTLRDADLELEFSNYVTLL